MPASVASIARDLRGERRRVRGARLDQQRGAVRAHARAMRSGKPGLPSTERSAARSASSTAATGALFSARDRAAGGLEIVEQDQRARLVARAPAPWRYVISLMKPSVPSEPIIRCARMSIGSVKSTSALRL